MILQLALCQAIHASPVGNLSIEGFRLMLERIGFQAVQPKGYPGYIDVTCKGSTVRCTIRAGTSAEQPDPIVKEVTGSRLFSFPQMLPKRELAEWIKGQRSEGLAGTSYLDGSVELRATTFTEPKQEESDVEVRFKRLFRAISNFQDSFGKGIDLGDRMSENALEPNARMDDISPRDLFFMERRLGWEFKKGWGGSSNGWLLPATIRGTDYLFREMVNPVEHGVPPKRTGFYVELDRKYDAAWTTAWCKANESRISWAKVFDNSDGRLILVHFVDLTDSPTVREIKEDIERFAGNVEGLRLPPVR